jgi:hypothetical protein
MSKRFNLREFQQGVLDRLQARVAGGGSRASTLGVQVGDELWLVDMSDISEVLSPPPLTGALTKPWYCGVMAAALYSIVDLGTFAAVRRFAGRQSRVLLAEVYAMGLLVSCAGTQWIGSRAIGRSFAGWRRANVAQTGNGAIVGQTGIFTDRGVGRAQEE